MRVILSIVAVASVLSMPCLAQEWELGGTGGYGWSTNPSIVHPTGSIQPGFAPKGSIGVVFGNNMYEHMEGEFRYMFQFGDPQLQSQGIRVSAPGYTNTITYELLFHATNREAKVRPFVAAGAGIRVYTGGGDSSLGNPPLNSALLRQGTQVEPAISVGMGLKYQIHKHAILRVDFRTYMTPFPDQIFKPAGASTVNGWVFSFVPLGGISFVF